MLKFKMDFGARSFPLFRRCRGVVAADAVDARQRFKFQAEELPSAEENPRTPAASLKPIYVLELAGGYATHQGGHVTRDSLLIAELSQYLEEPIEKNRLLRSFRLFRGMKKIDGTVLSLATPCQYNYYHWMLEALPKLALFQRYGPPDEGAFYYAESSKAFQADSLDLLGIAPSARIDSREHQTLRAGSLWAASIPGPSGVAHPWAVRWLRDAFFQALPPAGEPIDCLVVSRRQARSRKIVNEDDLLAALAPFAPRCVALEDLTLAQQIDLFRRARIIVAPHGAGLTNLVFARPDATVIELFGASYRNPCYERIARVVKCGYQGIVNENVRDPVSHETNTRVQPELVREAVQAAASTPGGRAGFRPATTEDRSSAAPVSPLPEHIVRLDVVRALAFLSVYIFHLVGPLQSLPWKGAFHDFSSWPGDWWFLLPSVYGFLGVAMFFVLSGFCIHYAQLRRGTFSARDFFWRRFLRLYPAYVVSVIVFACLERWLPFWYFNGWQVVTHLLLIHNFTHETFFGINGSFWSLGVEAQFYLLYPLLLVAAARWGMARSVVIALVLNFVCFLYILGTHNAQAVVHPLWSFPLVTWCDWILGAALAEAYVQGRKVFIREKTWLVGSGLLLLMVMNVKCLNVQSYLFSSVFFTVALQRYLSWKSPLHLVERALIPVGLISYSLYLWHEPLIFLVNDLGNWLGIVPTKWGQLAWACGVSTLLVGLVSTASYWVLEVRAPRWIRGWVAGRT